MCGAVFVYSGVSAGVFGRFLERSHSVLSQGS